MERKNEQPGGRQNFLDKIRDAAGIHRKGLEMLKIAHKIDSSAIPLRIMGAVIRVANIYLGLFLTARLIDSLLAAAFSRALFQAGIMILMELLLETADLLTAGAQDKSWNRVELGFYTMIRDKAFSLDYETMEQPEVVDRIIRSERTVSMYGGLNGVLSVYENMLESLLTIVSAVGLTAALCFARPGAESGVLAMAAQPAVSAALVTVFACVTFLIYAKGTRFFQKKDERIFGAHTDVEIKLDYMIRHVLNDRKTAKVVRIYDMKEMLLANFRQFNRESTTFFSRWAAVDNQGALFRNTVNGTFVVFAYLFVAIKALTGAITIGTFTQYAGALTKLAGGFQEMVESSASLRKNCLYMEDLLAFLHTENTHMKGSIPVEKRLDGEYEIEFRDVSFHYPGSEELVLKHVNCRLTMKNKMAVVGRNGAGKTTFIKLLCRLYEPTEGSILLNGVDIRKYKEEEYRELFSVVFQDFKLFAFPVSGNLAAGYERNDKKLQDCLERAGAAEFIRELPLGMDTLLYKKEDGGVEISGGQAQKLALARALYKDAPFVVLDEPTAALDPISEAQVYAGFGEMVKEKTSIYISHRMSSCRFCDEIIVFDQGQIIERGSHEELLDRQGQYAEMWNAQAKYYVE